MNLYAAMTSMHVAWAAWCALAVVTASRGRWRRLAWLYPAVTTLVVLASANHFLLDAAGALTLTGTAPAAEATAVIIYRVAGCWAVGGAGTAVAAALARRSPGVPGRDASRQPSAGRRSDGSRPARTRARRHCSAPCRHGRFHPQAHHRVTPCQGHRS